MDNLSIIITWDRLDELFSGRIGDIGIFFKNGKVKSIDRHVLPEPIIVPADCTLRVFPEFGMWQDVSPLFLIDKPP